MAEISSRLGALRDGLRRLQAELVEAEQPAAAEQVGALIAELDGVIRDTSTVGTSPAPRPLRARIKPAGAERCPLCTIRSLHMLPETLRPGRDERGEEEVLWRCLSCGHETWREIG